MISPIALADLTTIGVGGVPELLRVAISRDEIISEALAMWAEADDWLVLGGGSNLVVADQIPNLQVLQISSQGIDWTKQDGKAVLQVQAGTNWDQLVEFTVTEGLTGIEALSGIPGSVGAAPVQNIGAYGAELSSVLTKVEFLDFLTGEVETIPAAELGLGYRDSIFKRGRQGIITMVELQLDLLDGLSAPIAFPQLAQALGVELGAQLPLAQVRSAVLTLRNSKGMVYNPTDADTRGCGSFFTNPVVSDRLARTLPTDAPRWEVDEDGFRVKLSAAWLIEHAGIPKGFALPGSGAALSTKHSLAITNRGGASAEDVLQLAEFIQLRVANQFGVNLQPEPNLIGF
jgi:UDP-N-acetylmuramate dehydrogenase